MTENKTQQFEQNEPTDTSENNINIKMLPDLTGALNLQIAAIVSPEIRLTSI